MRKYEDSPVLALPIRVIRLMLVKGSKNGNGSPPAMYPPPGLNGLI